ncbi:MAG TPA: helix-turn-helix domain-containing protein [Bdellovibrionales bacterium]|nr:helix-turn-helix domain-containing protein [Bdellovibrionales bacterium]
MDFSFFAAKGIRVAAALQWAVLIYWILRAERPGLRSRVLGALAVTIVAYLVAPLPLAFGAPFWLQAGVLSVACASGFMIWLSAHAFFDDGFRLRPWHFAVLAVSNLICLVTISGFPTSAWLYGALGGSPVLFNFVAFMFPQMVTLVFIVFTLRHVSRGGRDDLVEPRLRLRLRFVRYTATLAFIVIAFEVTMKAAPFLRQYLDAASSFLVFYLGYVVTYQYHRNLTMFEQAVGEPHPAPAGPRGPEPEAGAPKLKPSPLDESQRARFEDLVGRERIYTQPGLTVQSLSEKLGVPDYKLRQHINQSLGFQNFNQFLNFHRVGEAKRLLSAPEGQGLPIYNLSVDLGYGSLVSFNRAFKEATGLTPTEFRDRARAIS